MKPLGTSVVIDRVFLRADSGDEFGPIRECGSVPGDLPPAWTPVAEDSCGNYFLFSKSHGVAFWNHETEEVEVLASDWNSFVQGCVEETELDLAPSQVVFGVNRSQVRC